MYASIFVSNVLLSKGTQLPMSSQHSAVCHAGHMRARVQTLV